MNGGNRPLLPVTRKIKVSWASQFTGLPPTSPTGHPTPKRQVGLGGIPIRIGPGGPIPIYIKDL
jgi:hypothetical protein